MIKKYFVLLFILSFCLMIGCSNPNSSPLSENIEALDTSLNHNATDLEETENIDENTWDYITANYPHVSYDEIKSGDYNGKYVILPTTIDNITYLSSFDRVECDIWFPSEQFYLSDKIYFYCDELFEYSPQSLISGDNIDICLYINKNGTLSNDVKGFCHNNKAISLISIYDSFKENCSSFDYESIIANPDYFSTNTFSVSGEVLQVLSNNNREITLLLSIGINEYIRVSYIYKEHDFQILKGDKLIVYGIFDKLYDYSTNTADCIPNIIARVIDNTSAINEENTTNTAIIRKEVLEEEPSILSAVNNYRFHNTINNVTLEFEEIYLISSWNDIKPHNDSFLIMKVNASSDAPGKNTNLYYFPDTIVDSNGTSYVSINKNFKYNYEDTNGNTIDIATEINLGFVWKEEGKISAYNTNFVNKGNGTRYLVFDIPIDAALDSNSYLIFFGTNREIYENEAPPKNIYFSDFVQTL